MIAEEALRYLAHEAKACRDRDAHEAFCLLMPAIMKLTALKPMDNVEAAAYYAGILEDLRAYEHPEPVHVYG